MEQPLASSAASLAKGDGAARLAAATGAPTRPLAIDDERTVSQLRRGQTAAMQDLVERYQDRLFTTVLRMVNHPEDAADLVQETFVRVMQNITRFEGKSSLYTWLFRIAVNLALSHRRSRTYRDALSLDGDPDGEGDTLNRQALGLRRQLSQTTEPDPALAAEVVLEHERIIASLQRLEPDFRAVIVLRDVEDCDYEQMAAILELPLGTVKSRLFRARMALREAVSATRENK